MPAFYLFIYCHFFFGGGGGGGGGDLGGICKNHPKLAN